MYKFRVLVNNKPIKIYYDENGNMWVWGKPNSSFALELKNETSNKIVGVFGVDGINVISGEKLTLSSDNGYIINPYSNIVIEGWRISNNKIRKFQFTDKIKDYYSTKLGVDSNIKNFTVYIFEHIEHVTYTPVFKYPYYPNPYYLYYPYQPYYYYYYSDTTEDNKWGLENNVLISNNNNFTNYNSDIGVKMGKGKTSIMEEEYIDNLVYVKTITIFYDSFINLKKKGILDNSKVQFYKINKFCPEL